MDETGFRQFLKQKRRSAHTIEQCMRFTSEFENHLGSMVPPKSLDEASAADIQAFTSAHKYGNSVLWGIGRYYEFSGNQALRRAASLQRERAIADGRDRKRTRLLAELPDILPAQVLSLKSLGINNQADLLSNCTTLTKLEQVASASRLPAAALVALVQQADLSRIVDIKNKRYILLMQAGFDSVRKIAASDPADLQQVLTMVNADKKILRRAPTLVETTYWVRQARELPCIIQY